mmetsp:Transcript_45750/g.90207  ORF Transcript_45750/g.90207 Transcript_45750/m.90207 type:complete len:326 (+) Transcript_45750:449-1426(+)
MQHMKVAIERLAAVSSGIGGGGSSGGGLSSSTSASSVNASTRAAVQSLPMQAKIALLLATAVSRKQQQRSGVGGVSEKKMQAAYQKLCGDLSAGSSIPTQSSNSREGACGGGGGAGGGGGGGAQLTLWEVASWAPLTLLLLLLRDDGGLFSGLGTRNKYHPVLSALLGRLAWSPFHALFVRGAPFFVVTPSLAAAAKAAALAAKGAAGSAAFTSLGLDAVAAAKARAWRELSFWTAESLFTPALETTLLLALWPTLSLALEFLWLNQRTANATTNTVLLLAPLNLISLVLSRQLGTQLLGVAGLCLAMWQMTALSDLARRSQERI